MTGKPPLHLLKHSREAGLFCREDRGSYGQIAIFHPHVNLGDDDGGGEKKPARVASHRIARGTKGFPPVASASLLARIREGVHEKRVLNVEDVKRIFSKGMTDLQ